MWTNLNGNYTDLCPVFVRSSRKSLCWLVFIYFGGDLTQMREVWEEETTVKGLPTIRLARGHRWNISLIDDYYERAQSTMGGTTPGHVDLGCIRKQADDPC